MKIVLAVYIFIHGFAHLVGFLSYWKLLKDPNMPFKTTLFMDRIDVGNTGIKIVGLIWLLVAMAYAYVGIILLKQYISWYFYAWIVTIVSLVLCVSGYPDTKYGILANVILIVFLVLNGFFHWL